MIPCFPPVPLDFAHVAFCVAFCVCVWGGGVWEETEIQPTLTIPLKL